MNAVDSLIYASARVKDGVLHIDASPTPANDHKLILIGTIGLNNDYVRVFSFRVDRLMELVDIMEGVVREGVTIGSIDGPYYGDPTFREELLRRGIIR